MKQREKHPAIPIHQSQYPEKHHLLKSKTLDTIKENGGSNKEKPKFIRNKSSNEIILRAKDNAAANKQQKSNENHCQNKKKTVKKSETNANKENDPKTSENHHNNNEVKSKMWIRPKSAQTFRNNNKKRTDPVALYQEYQKDWAKFKNNICESSRSELRWAVREKLLSNH